MTVLQIVSASPPYDRPALGMRALRLLGLVEAMGLLPAGVRISRLDRETLLGPIRQLQSKGIGRAVALELDATEEPERLAALLDRVYDELLASPAPDTEVDALIEVLGPELVAHLAGISPSSLRRYATGERSTPDAVAARTHHVAVIVSHLAAGYNEFGIRRWFGRPRPQLDGRTPADLLHGEWDPDDDGPQRVLQLAAALNSSHAT